MLKKHFGGEIGVAAALAPKGLGSLPKSWLTGWNFEANRYLKKLFRKFGPENLRLKYYSLFYFAGE